jgi:predicted transcriptional regulator
VIRSAIERDVYQALCLGPLTIGELVQITEISRSACESAVKSLVDYGVLRVIAIRRRGIGHGSGRPATIYAIVEERETP